MTQQRSPPPAGGDVDGEDIEPRSVDATEFVQAGPPASGEAATFHGDASASGTFQAGTLVSANGSFADVTAQTIDIGPNQFGTAPVGAFDGDVDVNGTLTSPALSVGALDARTVVSADQRAIPTTEKGYVNEGYSTSGRPLGDVSLNGEVSDLDSVGNVLISVFQNNGDIQFDDLKRYDDPATNSEINTFSSGDLSTPENVEYHNGRLYVLDRDSPRIVVIDVGNWNSPAVTDTLDFPAFNNDGSTVVKGTTLFARSGDELISVDVTDPTSIVLEDTYSGLPQGRGDFVIVNQHAVMTAGGTVYALDVSDPANITLTDSVDINASRYRTPVMVNHDSLFTFEQGFDGGDILWEISMAGDGSLTAGGNVEVQGSGWVYEAMVVGDVAYILNAVDYQVHIIDLTDITNYWEIAQESVPEEPRGVTTMMDMLVVGLSGIGGGSARLYY
jgi:hypothetical protein